MKLEFFFGAGCLALGLLTHGFGLCVVGVFFILVVAVEVIPAWIRHEIRLWRKTVRHDFDHTGLQRVDERRPAA